MDNSKEYINMCSKAVEIQEYRNMKQLANSWVGGDFGYYKGGVVYRAGHFVVTGCSMAKLITTIDIAHDRKSCHWLPRQDQLQEMVNNGKDLGKECDFFYWWLNGEKQPWYPPKSMEQLWLAFVMNEKYNKRWNGTDWVTLK